MWPADPFSDPDCAHEWGEVESAGISGGPSGTPNEVHGKLPTYVRVPRTSSAFCRLCGAWRGELGLEPTFDLFLSHLVSIFEEARRVLKPTGVCFVNMGDSYSCSPNGRSAKDTKAAGRDDRTFRDKPDVGATSQCGLRYQGERRSGAPQLAAKQLIGQPWRLAFALQEAGWWLRSDCIWWKRNAMPSSVDDRPGVDHEYVFLLTKTPRYFYDSYAVMLPVNPMNAAHHDRYCNRPVIGKGANPNRNDGGGRWQGGVGYNPAGRNLRTVWDILPEPSRHDHYASFPRALPRRCILAGSSEHGCCASCGKPWERVVRKSGGAVGKLGKENEYGQSYGEAGTSRLGPWNGDGSYTVESLGWRPTCRCKTEERVPAVILDPFAGTATTLAVAIELGRRAIGIELHPKYCKIAKRRILAARVPLPGLTECEEPAPARVAVQGALL